MSFFISKAAESFPNLLLDRWARRWVTSGVLVALLAGCATGDVALLVPVVGGEKVRVPVARGGAQPTEIGGFEVKPPRFAPNDDKTRLIYSFEVSNRKRQALRSIRVEDVSDTKPHLLLEDAMPTLADGVWRGVSRPLAPSDEGLKWIYSIDNSARVFRFTIVTEDGRSVVANQGTLFPNVLKAAVRQTFGEKY
ncbi:MAG: hypothetical protein ABIZ49_08190 [Opitutaceae bacterium]